MTARLVCSRFIFCLLIHASFCANGQTEPRWISYTGRTTAFPATKYLTGFASEINNTNQDQNELLARLEGLSKDQLVENIMVDIRSISTLNIHNINTETHESFKHNSTSFSRARISGLKVERFYDVKKKIGYAFAYAEKNDVIQLYRNEIEKQVRLIESVVNLTGTLDKQSALKKYFETQPAFRTIEEAQTLIVTITNNFDDPTLKRQVVNDLKIKIEANIGAIRNSSDLTIDDAAEFLAFGLSLQAIDLPVSVKLANITYQDTPMGSNFSRKFQARLEESLLREGKFKVITPNSVKTGFVLTGTYWEEKDKIKVTSLLRDEVSGEAVASASCAIPIASLIQSNISYQPQNYKEAMVNMKMFAKDEMKGGDLQLEVATNKGKDAQIFTEGETMKLFVRANHECYLRFIYHLADGSKVLLLDNYYIDRDKVNMVYELPYAFECAEPFGVETLQLNAQTEPFESLTVKKDGGYDFIQENAEQILTKTRGFKRKAGEILVAEEIIVFTTMQK